MSVAARWRGLFVVCGVACLALYSGATPHAQFEKNISVTFDGWNRMADGGYELVFGYLNRNPEAVEIPVGPENAVEPGGPDRGQPTTFPHGGRWPRSVSARRAIRSSTPCTTWPSGGTDRSMSPKRARSAS